MTFVIDPGRLRRLIAIEQIIDRLPDGAGGYQEVWSPLPDGGEAVWAAIEPLTGSERIRAMQTRSNATHVVTIRWRPDVTALCRVVWPLRYGNIYEITEPPRSVPDERDTHLVFQVRVEPVEAPVA